MSQNEIHIGKLRKIEIFLPLEEYAEKICKMFQKNKESYYKSWVECFNDKLRDKYRIINGSVYEFIEHQEFEDGSDVCYTVKNPDGTISFVYQFYNGGTCLQEILEEEVERLNNEQ